MKNMKRFVVAINKVIISFKSIFGPIVKSKTFRLFIIFGILFLFIKIKLTIIIIFYINIYIYKSFNSLHINIFFKSKHSFNILNKNRLVKFRKIISKIKKKCNKI